MLSTSFIAQSDDVNSLEPRQFRSDSAWKESEILESRVPQMPEIPEMDERLPEDRMATRKSAIDGVCNRMNLTNVEDMFADRADGGVLHHLIVDDVDHAIYCYIPKVACTNWKRVLMVLMGKTNATDPLDVDRTQAHHYKVFRRLNSYTRSEAEFMLSNYTKFLFVRHPLERLLSAYRNKFVENLAINARFHTIYGRKIIKRYRINATKESLERGHDVTFDEFSRFVTDTEGPEKPLNEHWRPMVELCRPCEIKYDLIGKYETLDEDARLVLDTISPNRPLKFPTQPSANNSAVIKDFYRMLKPDLLQKIYGLFNLDFRIFDYTPIDLS